MDCRLVGSESECKLSKLCSGDLFEYGGDLHLIVRFGTGIREIVSDKLEVGERVIVVNLHSNTLEVYPENLSVISCEQAEVLQYSFF